MSADKKLRRSGIIGMVLGVFAILLCALPWVLVLVGLGGLSAALTFIPFAQLEIGGLILFFFSAILLLFVWIRRGKNREVT